MLSLKKRGIICPQLAQGSLSWSTTVELPHRNTVGTLFTFSIISSDNWGASPLNSKVSLSSQFNFWRSRGLMRTFSFSEICVLRLLITNVQGFNSPFFVFTFSKKRRRDSPRTVVSPAARLFPITTVTW